MEHEKGGAKEQSLVVDGRGMIHYTAEQLVKLLHGPGPLDACKRVNPFGTHHMCVGPSYARTTARPKYQETETELPLREGLLESFSIFPGSD